MQLIFYLVLTFSTNVLSDSLWKDSEENLESPPRKSLKDLHGSIKDANRRHIEHIDAKWDTSDMDSDEISPSKPAGRRFLSLDGSSSKLTPLHLSLSRIMPYFRTLLAELLKKLNGTAWESVGKNILGIVDGFIDVINKTEKSADQTTDQPKKTEK